MITEINEYADFLLAEYQLIIDIDDQMINYIQNEFYDETYTTKLVKDFNDIAPLKDQFGMSKKILGDLLASIEQHENNLNKEKTLNFIISQNNYYNLSVKLFELSSNKNQQANEIFDDFFTILFYHYSWNENEYVDNLQNILNKLESLEIDSENIFLQSMYNIFLRVLLAKNAILENKELTKKLTNKISSQITRNNIIHKIFYTWGSKNYAI